MASSSGSKGIRKRLAKAKEDIKKGKIGIAMRSYRSILKKDPENEEALRGLAQLLILRERYREAQELLDKIMELYPEDEYSEKMKSEIEKKEKEKKKGKKKKKKGKKKKKLKPPKIPKNKKEEKDEEQEEDEPEGEEQEEDDWEEAEDEGKFKDTEEEPAKPPSPRDFVDKISDAKVLSGTPDELVAQRHMEEILKLDEMAEDLRREALFVFSHDLDIGKYKENIIRIDKALSEAKEELKSVKEKAKKEAKKAEKKKSPEKSDEAAEKIYKSEEPKFYAPFSKLKKDLRNMNKKNIELVFETDQVRAATTLDRDAFFKEDGGTLIYDEDGKKKTIKLNPSEIIEAAISKRPAIITIDGKNMETGYLKALRLLKLNKVKNIFKRELQSLNASGVEDERLENARGIHNTISEQVDDVLRVLEPSPLSDDTLQKVERNVDRYYRHSELYTSTKAEDFESAIELLLGAKVLFEWKGNEEAEGKIIGHKGGKLIVDKKGTWKLFFLELPKTERIELSILEVKGVIPSDSVLEARLRKNVYTAFDKIKSKRLTPEHKIDIALSTLELAKQNEKFLKRIIASARELRIERAMVDSEKQEAKKLSLGHYRELERSKRYAEMLAILKDGFDNL